MHQSARSVIPPDAQGVAVNRIRFLTMEQPEASRVRPEILASWQRSRALKVAADKVDLPYVRDPNVDTPLTRTAEPILRQLHQQLAGEPVSIVLTDAAGLVLSRRSADASLDRHLDRVLLAPGFSYAEQFVGTNGIGTALEAGSATQVFGHEHYAENLEDLACAGVPIHDPGSGRLMGVVDLTCWRKDAETLLLTLAKSTADQIERALLTNAGLNEIQLLQAFRQTCRRTTGIVFALAADAVMLNANARAELDPADQSALLLHAGEISTALAAGRRRSVNVTLPTGLPVRMYCHQVGTGDVRAGLVVHVRPEESSAGSGRERLADPTAGMVLPGLVGIAPLWRRACHQLETTFAAGGWVAVDGEPGVGKSALLRAVQLREHPARRFTALDATDAAVDRGWLTEARRTLAESDRVLISHLDALDAHNLRALSVALQEARTAPDRQDLWVAVTLRQPTQSMNARPAAPVTELNQVLALFPTTITVPPLRMRLEDLPTLVGFFLGKLGRSGQVTCSPEATRLLLRSSWPGNVAQLQQLLRQVVTHRRSGVITPADLPPELHSISRRVLSTLESIERDAIVRALNDADGNKMQAARSLGLSRATIYRKIHEFGIITH